MVPLHKLQADFRAALFAPAAGAVPAGLNFTDPAQAARRFDIHRNTMFVSLTEVLRAAFPVCALLVGESFWRRLAVDFILAAPPKQAHLLAWGDALPGFLQTYPGLEQAPYLPDMARLEWARVQAYHAREAPPLDLAALQAVPPENLPDQRFTLASSASLVSSPWPIVSLWQAHDIAAGTATPLPAGLGAEAVLVFRPQADVEMLLLSPGALALLRALAAGCTFGQAAMQALAEPDDAFNLQTTLVRLLLAGAFSQ